MIVGVGIDLASVERVAEALRRTPALAARLFTEQERTLSAESLAGRFAAKEALAKALRTDGGLTWTDAEVVTDADGAPSFALRGDVAARAAQLGVRAVHVSLSHDAGLATAFVVAES